MNDERSTLLGDEFDQAIRQLTGLPDCVSARGNITVQTPLGKTQDWVVQTFRRTERNDEGKAVKSFDVAFVRYMDADGMRRIVLPAEVLTALFRQRDSLTTKNQRKAGRATMQRRKAAGEDLGAALRDPKVQKAARTARKAKAARRAQAVRS